MDEAALALASSQGGVLASSQDACYVPGIEDLRRDAFEHTLCLFDGHGLGVVAPICCRRRRRRSLRRRQLRWEGQIAARPDRDGSSWAQMRATGTSAAQSFTARARPTTVSAGWTPKVRHCFLVQVQGRSRSRRAGSGSGESCAGAPRCLFITVGTSRW